MSFAEFGVRSFVPETRVEDFASFLQQRRVMVSRCSGCGQLAFPPRAGCARCGSEEHDWEEITEPGQLLTYTRVMYGPAGFEDQVPYTLAVVAFAMGVNVFGQFAPDVAADHIRVGMKVAVVTRPLPGGRVSYHFVKAGGDHADRSHSAG